MTFSQYVLAVRIVEDDFFNRAVYFVLLGSFLFLLSLLSLSFTRVTRKLPLNIFCCHSTDFIIASKCVPCIISTINKRIRGFFVVPQQYIVSNNFIQIWKNVTLQERLIRKCVQGMNFPGLCIHIKFYIWIFVLTDASIQTMEFFLYLRIKHTIGEWQHRMITGINKCYTFLYRKLFNWFLWLHWI